MATLVDFDRKIAGADGTQAADFGLEINNSLIC
jgi:hypothetical protein